MSSRRNGIPPIIWIGAGLLILAVISFSSTFASLVRGEAHEEQFSAPGTHKVTVQVPGDYYLWNHYKTVYEGETIKRNKKFPNGLSIVIKDSEGLEVPFERNGEQSWSIGNHAKTSIGYIKSTGNQSYTIEVTGDSNENVILSFSQSLIRNDLWVAFRGFVVALAAGLLGILLLLWGVFFSRKR